MDAEQPAHPSDMPLAPSRRRSVLFDRLIPAITVLLVVGLLGLLAYSLLRPDLDGGRPAGIVINESGALVNVKPRPASDFTLELFDGSRMRLSDLRGQVVVVNFWASWCPPCRREAAQLETAWQALQDEGVVFLGIDVWDDRDDALGFIEDFGVSYPNGPDKDGAIAIEYGVTGIPETYIVDRQGRLAAKFVGPITVEQLTATIRALGP